MRAAPWQGRAEHDVGVACDVVLRTKPAPLWALAFFFDRPAVLRFDEDDPHDHDGIEELMRDETAESMLRERHRRLPRSRRWFTS